MRQLLEFIILRHLYTVQALVVLKVGNSFPTQKLYPLNRLINNYLKSRWIVAKYLPSRESGEVNSQSHYSPRLKRIIVLVYTHEVISTKSERKPLKSTISLTDQITRKFKNRSLRTFQTWQFTSLSFRKQQRNGLNGTAKSLNCFLTWEEK